MPIMESLSLCDSLVRRGSVRVEHYRNGKRIGIRNKDFIVPNTITAAGKAIISGLLIATGTAPTHIAYGVGTPSTTALGTESDRQAATRSQVTVAVTNDTAQYVYTFAIVATLSVTEAGLFNAAAGPTMVCSQSFTAVPVLSGDTLLVTWKLQA